MPTDKDFKRLVRGRMQKTGESYTAARSHLLRQKPITRRGASLSRGVPASRPKVAAAAQPAPVAAEPLVTSATTDFARIAGMTDEAVKKATGCPWDKWVKALDYVEAYTWPHREIADYVHEKYKVPDCVFRPKSDTRFGGCRTAVSEHVGHPFRSMSDT